MRTRALSASLAKRALSCYMFARNGSMILHMCLSTSDAWLAFIPCLGGTLDGPVLSARLLERCNPDALRAYRQLLCVYCDFCGLGGSKLWLITKTVSKDRPPWDIERTSFAARVVGGFDCSCSRCRKDPGRGSASRHFFPRIRIG